MVQQSGEGHTLEKVVHISKIGWRIILGVVTFFLVFIAGAVALSALNIPGNYKLLTVKSGSMEPAIKTGSVVVIQPVKEYKKGDVITVKFPSNTDSFTHRIFNIETKDKKTLITTKGDANKTSDPDKAALENVLGKVLLAIPYIGYPISFAKTQNGLIFMIIIPATLLVYTELMNIKNEILKILSKRKTIHKQATKK